MREFPLQLIFRLSFAMKTTRKINSDEFLSMQFSHSTLNIFINVCEHA